MSQIRLAIAALHRGVKPDVRLLGPRSSKGSGGYSSTGRKKVTKSACLKVKCVARNWGTSPD